MTVQHKTLQIKIVNRTKDGGEIVISTSAPDRDKDRVNPLGARVENYLANPVVQWGHNYGDPWATIGRTSQLSVSPMGMSATFELRPAANDADPQNIVRLLWEQEFIRAASIGFMPDMEHTKANDMGGLDFDEWELLEWSLVPIPANAGALRLAEERYPKAFKSFQQLQEKRGSRHSAKDRQDIQDIHDAAERLGALCKGEQDDEEDEEDAKRARSSRRKEFDLAPGAALAWVRRLEVESDFGAQQLYAVFRSYVVNVPKDATVLRCDDAGELVEVPDPDAGQSVQCKEVMFCPPIGYSSDIYGDDATYSISGKDREDAEIVKGFGEWDVLSLSDPLDVIPLVKSFRSRKVFRTGVQIFTQRGLERAKLAIRRGLRRSARPADELTEEDGASLLLQLRDISSALRSERK